MHHGVAVVIDQSSPTQTQSGTEPNGRKYQWYTRCAHSRELRNAELYFKGHGH